ncbi:MAG: hypothetical protein JSW07_01600 [bacterium]|nr:MAG: hypothetical protein JSW07_01600 [bacterium]
MLLIDVKSDADSTYEALRNVLKKYKSMSTTFSSNSRNDRPIVAVISGNRLLQMMEHEQVG